MRTKLGWLIALGLLGVALLESEAPAQGRMPYQLTRPPISPYFDLFRRDTGGLPSYYQFVRPQLQFRQFVENETVRIERMQRQAYLQGGLQTRQTLGGAPAPGAVQLRPTAEGVVPRAPATFMNYSHYYTIPPTVRGAAGRP